ncbi:hypothetical protein GCM10010412_021870 [Nonomuraea recticatena]|uniref:Uncharacterized protein n=1 Tax=Nonomuraea recticatena TaxID=46178 RepID=A0ABN3RL95_9ACTN
MAENEMKAVGAFHGAHAAAARPGHVAINWTTPTPRCNRISVRRHTCECVPEVFELCQAGGLRFIRRTVREAGAVVVHESDWAVSAVAGRLWELLLGGHAR